MVFGAGGPGNLNVMTVSAELVDRLLFESEGNALDFKSAQYLFDDDVSKSELLKDILAFANSWRRTDAYIIIGAVDGKGDRAQVVGVTSHFDDATLQQFVNSKVQRPIHFSYVPLKAEGKDVAVIHIPLQDRPFFLRKAFGKLQPDIVYLRRGSSTVPAKPDEIARMGRAEESADAIDLSVFFWDPESRTEVNVPLLHSRVLHLPPRKSIPDLRSDRGYGGFDIGFPRVNSDYYRELVVFTGVNELLKPLFLAVRNRGRLTAHDVRIDITIPARGDVVRAVDDDDFPEAPAKEWSIVPVHVTSAKRQIETVVQRVKDDWLIRGRIDKVQPDATVGLVDPFYLGATEPVRLDAAIVVYADNLPSPHRQSLSIQIDSVTETADLDRVEELESDRILATPYARRLLEQLDEESGE